MAFVYYTVNVANGRVSEEPSPNAGRNGVTRITLLKDTRGEE